MPLFGFGRKKSVEIAQARRTSPGGAYEGLREMVLGLDADQAGAQQSDELPHVWGVIVDWGTDSGVATFVALADGTSSMYTSRGGGVIGAGGHEPVRQANRALLLAAEAANEDLAPAEAVTSPVFDRVNYWVRTYAGFRTTSHANGPPDGPPWLAVLAEAFQDFVTAIRISESARK